MKYLLPIACLGVALTACSAASKNHGAGTEAGGASAAGPSGAGGAPGATTSTSSGAGAHPASSTGTTTSTASSGKATSSTAATTSSTSSGGTSSVSIYVTPDQSVENDIVSALQGAQSSIHMTMYILDNSAYVNALVARKKAGVDVRVVLNQNFPSGTFQSNPTTYSTLTAAGVGVVWRNGPPNESGTQYTHEKAFTVDGKQVWIMTMNLDNSAPRYNREYIVVDDNAADVQEADAIFLADYNGTSTSDGAPLVVSPNNSRSAIVALIEAATKTVDIEVEEFGDNYSTGVAAALAAAAKRGVATRLILANDNFTTSQMTAVATVKAAGTKVVVSGGTSGGSTSSNPYIHAKAITIDCSGTTCARGFIGSENLSAGSLSYNRELGLIVTDATQLAKVQAAIDSDFSTGTPQ